MPKISVIVPVYKVEQFLARCVNSVLNQTFSDFELILVDDGSPDRCGAICDSFAAEDPRIHVIHQKNGGLSAARNAGLDWVYANSDSQWIAFVDSDDWVHPDYLQSLYQAAESTNCKISTCGFFKTSEGPFPEIQGEAPQCMSADDFYCSDKIHGGVTAVVWNKLYHRSVLDAIRFPAGKLHEDEFTTFQVVYNTGKIAVQEMPLYAYYQNPEGIMLSKWNPRRLHIVEAFEYQIAYALEHNLGRFYRKAVRDLIYSIHSQLLASEEAYHAQLRKKYRTALRLGHECGVFPFCWEYLWAYEEAYPVKPVWWLLFKGRHLLDRLTGKDKA